jgi:L-fuconolactonase
VRIDAHHHVWDLSVRDQDWMVGEQFAPIRRSFDLDDLRAAAASSAIDRTILVQTVAAPAETGEFLDLAATDDLVAGVVGWVDLASPQAMSDLDRQFDHPCAESLVGIRDLAQYRPDPGWFARAEVVEAIRGIGRRDLTFDLLVQPHQLTAATAAVSACPDQLFVLDHLGKPPIAEGALEPWASAVRRLASRPNVACKVSGMITEASWSGWRPADVRPYFSVVLEAFGPARLMFGSDWPVCTLAGSYERVVGLAEDLTGGLGEAEREEFWSGTAARYYPRCRAAPPAAGDGGPDPVTPG